MPIQNILVLIVLISLGTYHSIQAEVIRGVDVPRVNTEKIAGQWYVLATLRKGDQLTCAINMIERQSDNSFMIKTTYTFTAEARTKYPEIPNESVETVINATIEEDSNIIISHEDHGVEFAMIIFDINYDSHMVIYGAGSKEELSSGTDGFLMILSRQQTLPDGIMAKVEQSNFVTEGIKPDATLLIMNAGSCQ